MHSYLPLLSKKKRKLMNAASLYTTCMMKKPCCSCKSFKTSIKLYINTKKEHRAIYLNQKAWIRAYIDTNIKLRTQPKIDFEKDFF